MTDIFISYSHKDEDWKDEFLSHLHVLKKHKGISIWDDRQIKVGDDWYPKIKLEIDNAKLAILLITKDFLTSDFICREEIPKLLDQRKNKGLTIFPIIVKPCPWRSVPWLTKIQGATKNNDPLSRFSLGSYELELILSEIVNNLDTILHDPQPKNDAKSSQLTTVFTKEESTKKNDSKSTLNYSQNFNLTNKPTKTTDGLFSIKGSKYSKIKISNLIKFSPIYGFIFYLTLSIIGFFPNSLNNVIFHIILPSEEGWKPTWTDLIALTITMDILFTIKNITLNTAEYIKTYYWLVMILLLCIILFVFFPNFGNSIFLMITFVFLFNLLYGYFHVRATNFNIGS